METNELQEMREQMALLKDTLRQEQIVNNRLLREAMRGKVESIHRKAWVTGLCAAFVLTFGLYSFRNIGLSWWFIGGTTLMMLYSVADTLLIHRRLRISSVMTDDLRTVAYAARRMKKEYMRSLRIGWVISVLWIVWLGIEIICGQTIFAESSMVARIVVLGLMLFGGGVGFVIGYRMYRRVLDLCDDIIRQVEE